MLLKNRKKNHNKLKWTLCEKDSRAVPVLSLKF